MRTRLSSLSSIGIASKVNQRGRREEGGGRREEGGGRREEVEGEREKGMERGRERERERRKWNSGSEGGVREERQQRIH